MRRKSESELALIRESGRWCARAHSLLQEYSRVGVTETEASLRAGHEATLELFAALGDEIGQMGSSDGVSAGYRGQIGLRSSWAHAVAHNIEFQRGRRARDRDERPDLGLQRRARAGDDRRAAHRRDAPPLRPHRRRPARRVRGVPPRRDVRRRGRGGHALPRGERPLEYWRQHTGHGIGLRNHEAPFLDVGDPTPIEPGMVFTIEPGLYSPTVGGFRHSDTIAVTPDGIDVLTDYPRDIESLTIPAVTIVSRRMRGSVKTSRSSRLVVENSLTIAPSSPAWNQCSVSGGIRRCSPGRSTISCQTVKALASSSASGRQGEPLGSPRRRGRRPRARQRNVSSFPGVPSNGGCRCSGQVWRGKSTSSFAQSRSVFA